jgi:hypothetical protein
MISPWEREQIFRLILGTQWLYFIYFGNEGLLSSVCDVGGYVSRKSLDSILNVLRYSYGGEELRHDYIEVFFRKSVAPLDPAAVRTRS